MKIIKNEMRKVGIARKIFLFCFLLFISCFLSSKVFAESYSVEFRNADVKNAVRLLASVGNTNVVVPDKIEGKVTASFENINIKEAIGAILKANGFGYVEENGILMIIPQQDLALLGEDLTVHSYDLQHAKADQILPQIQALLTARGTAVSDERTNTVHIKDTNATIKNLNSLIVELDKKGQQVLIEARILEASVAFVQSIGIQWGVTKTGGNVQTAGLESVGTADSGRYLMFNSAATTSRSAAPLGGVGLILGSFKGTVTDIQISAAEQNGNVNVLARPSIVTMDNQPATIRSGIKFYIKTNADISIGGGGGSGTAGLGNNLQEINTGIELKVTPQVSENRFIKLLIEATQSEPDFSQEVENIPTILDNKANTTVLLKDGETTIIGGLFKIRDAKSVKGVPGLMKIPLLGNLFKSRTKEKAKNELLVFITPHIVEDYVRRLEQFDEAESTVKGLESMQDAENEVEADVKKAQSGTDFSQGDVRVKPKKQTARKHR